MNAIRDPSGDHTAVKTPSMARSRTGVPSPASITAIVDRLCAKATFVPSGDQLGGDLSPPFPVARDLAAGDADHEDLARGPRYAIREPSGDHE